MTFEACNEGVWVEGKWKRNIILVKLTVDVIIKTLKNGDEKLSKGGASKYML